MAATKRNAMLIEEARDKIRTTQLINRLQNHGLGTLELSNTQIRAIEILLRKSVPDLSSVEAVFSGTVNVKRDPRELTDEALAAIAAGSGTGASGEEEGEAELSRVH